MFDIVIYCLIGFVSVFAVVDRICKCIEHCSAARAYSPENAKVLQEFVEYAKGGKQ